jgi:hypothetical protein
MEAPASAVRESRLSSLQMPLSARDLLSQDAQSRSVHRFKPAFMARWCTARPAIILVSGNVRVLKAAIHCTQVELDALIVCLRAPWFSSTCSGLAELSFSLLDTTCWVRNTSQQSCERPSPLSRQNTRSGKDADQRRNPDLVVFEAIAHGFDASVDEPLVRPLPSSVVGEGRFSQH